MAADSTVHEADLTKGMEHMRFYVSVPSTHTPEPRFTPSPQPSTAQQDNPDVYGVPSTAINPRRHSNPQRPSSPTSNPHKRTDPFQFGSRILAAGDDIFGFNAWDHVDVDDAFKAFAAEQFDRQRESPASEYHRSMCP